MRKSFSTRLSIYILGVTLALFVVSFSIYFRYSSEVLLSEILARQESELEQLAGRFDAILSEVELSVESAVLSINDRIEQGGDFADIQRNMIDFNDAIYSVAIAFEPYKYDNSKKYFMQLTLRGEDKKLETKELGEEQNYDYFAMDWYEKPKLRGESFWSEPYFDKGGAAVTMTTYSFPIRNKNGELVAVATADVSLDWIARTIAEYKPYANSYSFMLSRNADFISHEERRMSGKEALFAGADAKLSASLKDIGAQMLAQKRGNREFVINGNSRYAFYAPIERSGWSIGTTSLKNDILSDIYIVNRYFWIIIACGLALIFIFTILVIRRATQPLVLFAKSADQISRGDFEVSLPIIKNRDEMYKLREAFENMQISLKKYILQLQATTAARERIESELAIARQIQIGMLPASSALNEKLPNLDLSAILQPAKEVGGDLYDFFVTDEVLYFAVGDASGKGIPAALLMAQTSSLFRSIAPILKEPARILESMNNLIAERNEANMFITLFVGALCVKTGELLYAGAGHNAPILIRDSKASFLDLAPNIALGIISDMEFISHKINISSQEMLFVYTDGLTEAENAERELYSNERLLAILSELQVDARAQDTLNLVSASLADFVRDNAASDDLTMLGLQIKSL